jgi:hypothetical protein
MLGPFVVNCVVLVHFLYSNSFLFYVYASAPLHSGWPKGGAYEAARESPYVFACFVDVQFESKNGVCEKVDFSFWLFEPGFAIPRFVNEFY